MTDTEANQAQAAIEPEVDDVAPAPPEPWTPRRVAEWNAYYDVYVAAFVLALAFLGSTNKIQGANSGLWSLLQTGRQISEAGSPLGVDASTVAGEGRRWVNIPWLFEVIHYQVFKAVAAFAPRTAPAGPLPAGPVAVPGEQWGSGALVILDALVRAVTALLLLGLRRKGPGLWWTAICVTLALGVTLSPEPVEAIGQPNNGGGAVRVVLPAIGIQLGGIAGTATVAPETWGILFLALELFLLHRAINLGKVNSLYGLIPMFALWANMDETFGFGLTILAGAMAGRLFDAKQATEPAGPSPRTTAIVLVAGFVATFLNPSHLFGVLGSFGILFRAVGLDLGPPSPQPISLFGSSFPVIAGKAFARAFQGYYAVLVIIGLASFALNRRRFSMSRFLMFALASVIWALALVYAAAFAVVFVMVLALNGQEWYQDTIGTEGRLGGGWAAWSTGGRLVTIAIIFAAIFQSTTGWGGQVGESRFGVGFDPDEFPFESADAIASSPIEGNVLNTTLAQGDALAWRTSGKRKPYIDSKSHLYPPQAIADFDSLRKAIRDDKVETWRPILDQSKISAVMIETASAPITYAKLMNSPNWVPFYDDGAVAAFGRTDSSAVPADVAYFKGNRLDANELAFKRPKPAPAWSGPPREVSELVDSVFQNRLLNRTQPHVEAARHWLRPATIPPGTSYLPDPAHCLLAVRELRTALSGKPDDFSAYRLLTEAYRLLLTQESALIAGIALTEANLAQIAQVAPQPRLLAIRTRQLLTALNSSALTLPPAKTPDDRVERANLNYNLAQLDLQNGFLDLARERLLAIDGRPGELSEDFFKNQTRLLGELNMRLEQIQTQINDLTIQRRASPPEKANFARSQGALGLAIRELAEAEQAGGNQAGIRPNLVDLYCETGQPDKALDLIATLNIDDPSLSSGAGPAAAGTASHRQGMIYFLLGDYENAISLWSERSISQLRNQRLIQAPMATQALLRGEPVASTRMFIELPEKVDQQAEWEFELGDGGPRSGFTKLVRGRTPPLVAATRTEPRRPTGDRLLPRTTRRTGPAPSALGPSGGLTRRRRQTRRFGGEPETGTRQGRRPSRRPLRLEADRGAQTLTHGGGWGATPPSHLRLIWVRPGARYAAFRLYSLSCSRSMLDFPTIGERSDKSVSSP